VKKKSSYKLSICIPNYNRGKYLKNCLNSIFLAKSISSLNFEICISDNASTENILPIINFYKKKKLPIKFQRNRKNLGFGANFYKVVKMAKGEFIWVIGNDDLLYLYSLKVLEKLFNKFSDVEFFFINSSNLSSKFVFNCKQPFNTKKIPNNLKNFSKIKKNKKTNFLDLIDPSVSWDFLLGIFLTVYKRDKFIKNLNILNKKKLNDPRVWSTIDNTAPHVKVFSYTFKNSRAYIQAKPLTASIFGEKEWNNKYPFIEIVRIPEILNIYRKNGMSFFQYTKCKNFILKRFIPYLFLILMDRKNSNYQYINFKKHILYNIFYPNIYFFGIFYVVKSIYRKILKYIYK
tara:strand:- start:83 stop:1120 length:1038 start_codon:yes stop_codon:yes gene_type:complete